MGIPGGMPVAHQVVHPAPEFWTQARRGMRWQQPGRELPHEQALRLRPARRSSGASRGCQPRMSSRGSASRRAGTQSWGGGGRRPVCAWPSHQAWEAVLGVVAAAHQGAALHPPEAHLQPLAPVHVESCGLHVALQGQVQGGGRQVLADGGDVHRGPAPVAHELQHLLRGLAQAHHDAALGAHGRGRAGPGTPRRAASSAMLWA